MVMHHHEKFDGTGYPFGLAGADIPLLTRMSTVCDVYDAITSNRPYKDAWDPGESLRRMASWKGHFDTRVLKALIASLGIYPVGTLVRLSSDRLAVVLEQRPGSLSRPLVRVFFSARTRSQLLHSDVDLSAPGCSETITGLESPQQWGFRDLHKLWAH
jgi:HD-GYP domain-containing protein (c-di-GMP phosphodiesterase class II)